MGTFVTVALYGGSFDPPHLGHVMVVSHLLLNDPTVDEILVIPCRNQAGKTLSHYVDRCIMTRYAFRWLPRVKVSDVAASIPDDSQTYRLIEYLHAKNPDTKYRWIMGSDLQEKAKTWEGWATIERLAPPLIIGRAGIAPLLPTDPTPICPAVSSSLVREALRAKDYRAAERYLPRKVLEYIIECGNLYGE